MTNDNIFRDSIAYLTPDTAKCHSFVMLPRLLLTHQYYKNHISVDEAMCYSLFWARTNMATDKKWIDSEGHIYIEYKFEHIMRDMKITDQTVTTYLNDLIEVGLLERVKRYQGLSNLYYVKDFTTIYDEEAAKDQLSCQENSAEDPESLSIDEIYKNSLKPLTQASVKLRDFIMVPRLLFTHSYYREKIKMREAILYSGFLARAQLSIKNNWVTKDGAVYVIYTYDEIKRDFGFTRPTASAYLKKLKNAGLLQVASAGKFRASTYFVMDYSSIQIDRSSTTDYMEFSSEDEHVFTPPVQVRGQQFLPFSEAFRESSPLSRSKQTAIPKTAVPASSTSSPSPRESFDSARERFLKECSLLLVPEMKMEQFVYNVVDIIAQVISNPKRYYKIGGQEIPGSIVADRFDHLTVNHIEEVINAITNTKQKIYNKMSYIISSLYQEVSTNAFGVNNSFNSSYYQT